MDYIGFLKICAAWFIEYQILVWTMMNDWNWVHTTCSCVYMQVENAFNCYRSELETLPMESSCGLIKALLVFSTRKQGLLETHKVPSPIWYYWDFWVLIRAYFHLYHRFNIKGVLFSVIKPFIWFLNRVMIIFHQLRPLIWNGYKSSSLFF